MFNGQRHLEQCIASVLGQTYEHIQYIVIDGGSTDGSVDIIKQHADRIAYWVSEKDNGISDAFNKGLAHCDGEVVGILNADDWYDPQAVELAMRQLERADVTFGDIQFWRDGKKEAIVKGNGAMLEWEMTLNHPTVFIKKHCYDEFGGFDTSLRCAMDYDLLLRLKVKGCVFSYVPHILANMRWGGMSDKQWKLGCKETLDIKNKYLPHKKWQHALYYRKHIFAIRANKLFTRLNLVFIIRFYRKLFSRVDKIQ